MDIWHGDWKTQIARKRHDIFRKGDTSRILKVFRNFDGIHVTVENHEGVKVDCPVHQLDFVSDNNTNTLGVYMPNYGDDLRKLKNGLRKAFSQYSAKYDVSMNPQLVSSLGQVAIGKRFRVSLNRGGAAPVVFDENDCLLDLHEVSLSKTSSKAETIVFVRPAYSCMDVMMHVHKHYLPLKGNEYEKEFLCDFRIPVLKRLIEDAMVTPRHIHLIAERRLTHHTGIYTKIRHKLQDNGMWLW